MDPYDVLSTFSKEYVKAAFADDDIVGPKISDVVAEIVSAMHSSLDAICIVDPPSPMVATMERLLATGLYGTRESEVLERLAAARLIQMVDDDSPLLTMAPEADG